MKSIKYAKRLAIYSIVFGLLSFFGNFASGPSELEGIIYICTLIVTLFVIVLGWTLNSYIKKGKENIKIPLIILLSFWGVMGLSGVYAIFFNITLSLLVLVFVIFPIYSGIKYFLISKNNQEVIEIEKEEEQ